MESWHNYETDKLCEAILQLKTKDECYAFLDDICTVTEILGISQRLAVALLLDKNENYSDISRETGASTATISRVSKCYKYGSGGYKTIIDRLKNGESK